MMNNIDFIMNQILSQKNIKEEKRTPEFLTGMEFIISKVTNEIKYRSIRQIALNLSEIFNSINSHPEKWGSRSYREGIQTAIKYFLDIDETISRTHGESSL